MNVGAASARRTPALAGDRSYAVSVRFRTVARIRQRRSVADLSPLGDEIFYCEGDRLMVVSTSFAKEPVPGRSEPLFTFTKSEGVEPTPNSYDISPQGDRFLLLRRQEMIDPRTGLALAPVVIQNWTQLIEASLNPK